MAVKTDTSTAIRPFTIDIPRPISKTSGPASPARAGHRTWPTTGAVASRPRTPGRWRSGGQTSSTGAARGPSERVPAVHDRRSTARRSTSSTSARPLPEATPLLLAHGYPSSFVEFTRMIGAAGRSRGARRATPRTRSTSSSRRCRASASRRRSGRPGLGIKQDRRGLRHDHAGARLRAIWRARRRHRGRHRRGAVHPRRRAGHRVAGRDRSRRDRHRVHRRRPTTCRPTSRNGSRRSRRLGPKTSVISRSRRRVRSRSPTASPTRRSRSSPGSSRRSRSGPIRRRSSLKTRSRSTTC